MLTAISEALSEHGLILRGGFRPAPGEDGPLAGVGTALLVGNAGAAMWEAFASHIDGRPNPLDRWTRHVVEPIAQRFGASTAYPFGAGAPPFQRWAARAESVFASPLGILIHPQFGLWHAYRAALLFARQVELAPCSEASHPCESCLAKPCITACPVEAFSGGGYDLAACTGHIAQPASDCVLTGCHARDACPVGREWRYPDEQIRFHMSAFFRSVTGKVQPPDP